MSKVHYATSWIAKCGKEMATYQEGEKPKLHTTLLKSVTCKKCLKKLGYDVNEKDRPSRTKL